MSFESRAERLFYFKQTKAKAMKTNLFISVAITGSLLACGSDLQDDNDDVENTDTSSEETDSEDTGSEDTGSEPDSQEPARPGALNELAREARDAMTQVFTVNADDFNTIQGDEGTVVYFWPQSLVDANGQTVTGNVDIELIEVYGKGQMLVSDVPTNGLLSSGEIAQLVSGGEFYVNASQNGEDLDLSHPYMVNAPTDNTAGPDFEMELFKIEEDGPDGKPAWTEVGVDPDTGEPNAEQNLEIIKGDGDGSGNSTAYSFLNQEFGWSNIDRWYSDPRPKTTIHVSVPDGWDDTNCGVYLAYTGENTLARFDTYDANSELFSEHYGLIPIGLEVSVIFMTESEGEWSYAIQQTTIVDNHVTVFDNPDDFLETDTDGLIAAIDALP
jgi:hypothetical protein